MIIGLDFDDTLVDTTGRIKEHFKEKYNIKLYESQNFRLRSKKLLPEDINDILWEKDTSKIFDWSKVKFIDGAIDFLWWCQEKKHKVTIQTASPIPLYVQNVIRYKLPEDLIRYIDGNINFGWDKHLSDFDILIDDDERFVEECERVGKMVILLKKPNYDYKRIYRWEANNFIEIKDIINRL